LAISASFAGEWPVRFLNWPFEGGEFLRLLPAVIIFSLIKETGPIITGLVVSGRVGAGIGAELGSMNVTEQIDAMAVSGVNPDKFLAATRVLACFIALPLLTLAADAAGIFLGWIATTLAEPTSLKLFLNNGLNGVLFSDFLPPTLKTALFGLIIGAVSSFQGMNAHGGTEGVGRSATSPLFFPPCSSSWWTLFW
jgi:phospholipid/cholesterol/gamma-HCH transport system permease protein